MKRTWTLLLAVLMMFSLLTVGAGASTTYTETVGKMTFTVEGALAKETKTVDMMVWNWDKECEEMVKKTITVYILPKSGATITMTNGYGEEIFPGYADMGYVDGAYRGGGGGGQITDMIIPGGSESISPTCEDEPYYTEMGYVLNEETEMMFEVGEMQLDHATIFYAFSSIIGEEVGAASDGNPFTDVAESDYFYTPVLWALENKVTTGATDTTFAPYSACTRAQVMTFLWRAKGCPAPTSTSNPFTDVKADAYYYDAVLWAVEQGITTGMTTTTFGPDTKCTNGHVVTFLWRAEGNPAADGHSVMGEETFAGQWYSDAISWADTTGLLQIPGEEFLPGAESPRARIVTYLYRNSVE